MSAAKYDFIKSSGNYIEIGATFSAVFTYETSAGVAINLTGYTARMQIKKSKSDSDDIIELNTTNSRIALGGSAGTITLTISAADTLTLPEFVGIYDLQLINGSVITRLLEGAIESIDGVTK
jgi:hypothetical protein